MTLKSAPLKFSREMTLLWAVRSGVLTVLAVPLIVTNDTFYPFVVGKAIFARSIIEVTLAAWVALVILYPKRRPAASWILAAFGLWVLVSLIASFTSVSFIRSIWSTYERMQGVFDLAHWFAFALIAASVFRTISEWRIVFSVSVAISIIVTGMGILHYYGLIESNTLEVGLHNGRLGSFLGNPIYLGVYSIVNLILAIGLLIHSLQRRENLLSDTASKQEHHPIQPDLLDERSPLHGQIPHRSKVYSYIAKNLSFSLRASAWLQQGYRLFLLFVVLSAVAALMLTGSRGAIVGLIVAAMLFALIYGVSGKRPIFRYFSYAFIAVSISIAALFISLRITGASDNWFPNQPIARVFSTDLTDSNVINRIDNAGIGMKAYLEKPILGWGPENFLIAWGRYFYGEDSQIKSHDQAHNKIVEVLATTGTVGIASYILIWLASAIALVRVYRRAKDYDQLLILSVAVALIAYFVQNLFLFDTPTSLALFSMLVAFAASIGDQVNRNHQGNAHLHQENSSVTKHRSSIQPRIQKPLLQQLSATLNPMSKIGLVIISAALIVASLTLFNLPSYSAAKMTLNVLTFSDFNSEYEERFERSVATFPMLANRPRIDMIRFVKTRLDPLEDREFNRAVQLVSNHVYQATSIEPQNWRIYLEAAEFYQNASKRYPEYLEMARELTDRAVIVAPTIPWVTELAKRQMELENESRENLGG